MTWAKRLARKGQIRKAIHEYKKMLEDDSKNVRTHSKLADLYLRDHKVDRAVEQYMQVARLYLEEDLKSRAISIYRRILNLAPNRVGVYHLLAELYTEQGLLGNARAVYQKIIRLNPKDESARSAIREIEKTISEGQRHGPEGISVSGLPCLQIVTPVSVVA
jgi:tetratricopeptide (TPR) repeat protein